VPRPHLVDPFRLDELRTLAGHRAARPTIPEFARGLETKAAARRWLAVHRRQLAAWPTADPTPVRPAAGSARRSAVAP
jgi:hypothetical protein